MDNSLTYWTLLTILCIAVQSFYSMLEMALVSFNKVRLGYWVDQGMVRAKWISRLLQRPSLLFGTTLLGVNIALQIGSECSRMVYLKLHLDPDIAPLTQVFLVLIFAELAPMFAARRYAENVAMLGIPFIYASSIILRPIIWLIGVVSTVANWLVGGPRGPILNVLSREELQHLVEEQEGVVDTPSDQFNILVTNIFNFRKKMAKEMMTPVDQLHMLSATATVGGVADLLRQYDVPCIPIYEKTRRNIVGIAFARDLIRTGDTSKVEQYSRPPWFITQSTPADQILRQFRYNNKDVAVVLDHNGQAIGLLTLDDVLDELFGEQPTDKRQLRQRHLIEKSFPGNTPLDELSKILDTTWDAEGVETLAQLLTKQLGHPPEEGEVIRMGSYEFKITEATLLGIRTVVVRTIRSH